MKKLAFCVSIVLVAFAACTKDPVPEKKKDPPPSEDKDSTGVEKNIVRGAVNGTELWFSNDIIGYTDVNENDEEYISISAETKDSMSIRININGYSALGKYTSIEKDEFGTPKVDIVFRYKDGDVYGVANCDDCEATVDIISYENKRIKGRFTLNGQSVLVTPVKKINLQYGYFEYAFE